MTRERVLPSKDGSQCRHMPLDRVGTSNHHSCEWFHSKLEENNNILWVFHWDLCSTCTNMPPSMVLRDHKVWQVTIQSGCENNPGARLEALHCPTADIMVSTHCVSILNRSIIFIVCYSIMLYSDFCVSINYTGCSPSEKT